MQMFLSCGWCPLLQERLENEWRDCGYVTGDIARTLVTETLKSDSDRASDEL